MGFLIFLIIVAVLVAGYFVVRKTFGKEIERYKRIRRSKGQD